jgi:uncharacterized oligopeptide transporter (OPT) family protein
VSHHPDSRPREFTARALLAGAVLGATFAVGNVYVGLKTGISDAATVTAAILGFAVFKSLRATRYSALENNITQTVSSSCAVMPAAMGFLGSFPALTMMGRDYPPWVLIAWGLPIGLLGIVIALPLRERFLNDESLPFPGAVATAEVIRAMHRSGAGALAKARALLSAGIVSALFTWFRDGRPRLLPAASFVPFRIHGIAAQPLSLGVAWSPLLFSIGALMGPRTGLGLFVGGLLAWAVVAPWAIGAHVVAEPSFEGLIQWLMWPGAALMIAGAATPIARDWRLLVRAGRDVRAVRGFDFGRGALFAAGLALAIVLVGWQCFGVHPLVLLGAIVISVIMAIVVARSGAETATLPLGTVGQLTQLALGPVTRAPVASVISASIPAGDGAQTGQMLETMKAGRILGASERSQIVAQVVGALVGAPFAALAYVVLTRAYPLGQPELPAPTALPWRVLAELTAEGSRVLPPYAATAAIVAMLLGVALTLLERTRFGRFVPSPVAVGLAFVLGGAPAFTMAAGALTHAILERSRPSWTEQYASSIAAGGLVGEALAGIVVASLLVANVLQ